MPPGKRSKKRNAHDTTRNIPTLHNFRPKPSQLPEWLPRAPEQGVCTKASMHGILRIILATITDIEEDNVKRIILHAEAKGIQDTDLNEEQMAEQVTEAWNFLAAITASHAVYQCRANLNHDAGHIEWDTAVLRFPRNPVPGQPTIILLVDLERKAIGGTTLPTDHTTLTSPQAPRPIPLPTWLQAHDNCQGLTWLRQREWTPRPLPYIRTPRQPHRLLILLLTHIGELSLVAPPLQPLLGGQGVVSSINKWQGSRKWPKSHDSLGILNLLAKFHSDFISNEMWKHSQETRELSFPQHAIQFFWVTPSGLAHTALSLPSAQTEQTFVQQIALWAPGEEVYVCGSPPYGMNTPETMQRRQTLLPREWSGATLRQ